MSFVRYKIGQQEQFVQFDQFYSLNKAIFYNVVELQGFQFEQGEVDNPLVTVSILPPKDIQSWEQKMSYPENNYFIVYSRERDGKIQAHFQSPMNIYKSKNIINPIRGIFASIIFKIILLNMILQNKNLVYLHGMLLNSGDVIVGDCLAGKSTLTARINNNNKNLKCLCDDDVILDIKNNLLYPISYLWDLGWDPLKGVPVDMKKPFKLKNLFLIRQDVQEKIYEIDKDEWLNTLYNVSILFCWHPFRIRTINTYFEKWIHFRKGLQQKVMIDMKERVKLFSSYKPLVITTNTSDQKQKFEVLQDVI